jgi:3-deoxy-D-manno-octulosonic acid kinase
MGYRADLITAELPTRQTLTQVLQAAQLSATTWYAIGRCIGRLHAHGVQHADLNAHTSDGSGRGLCARFRSRRAAPVNRGAWEHAVLRDFSVRS